MKEFITYSWYRYGNGDGHGLHPWSGETEFQYTGPKPPYQFLEIEGKYSWLKAPRWNEVPVEVGPLARMLAMYARGHRQTKELTTWCCKTGGARRSSLLKLGRTAARAIETKVFADALRGYFNDLVTEIKAGRTRTSTVKNGNRPPGRPEAGDSDSWRRRAEPLTLGRHRPRQNRKLPDGGATPGTPPPRP